MTVGQVSSCSGLQCCSMVTTRSRTRAYPAPGNIHLDDWEMYFGPLRIWHIPLLHVITLNHFFCIRWSFPQQFLEGAKSLNCLGINPQVIRYLQGLRGSSCARLGTARKGTGIFLFKPQKKQDTNTIQLDHLSFLWVFCLFVWPQFS